MIKPPCKGCLLREIRCHSTCERWMIYQREKDKERERIYTERNKYMETEIRKRGKK